MNSLALMVGTSTRRPRRSRRRLAAPAAEEAAQEPTLDRLRDHRPAAELGHRAERAVPSGGPRRPARATASRRAPRQRPLEAPGEEGVRGALRRAGGARMLFLNELMQYAQRLRHRVAPALPRLGQGALDRPGRER